MNIDKGLLIRMLVRAAELMEENSGYLSEIDSRFGDGDHGITIGKIARVIKAQCEEWQGSDLSAYDFFQVLGGGIMAVNGGSAGPLYGTMLEGLGEPLDQECRIDGALLKKMLEASRLAMEDVTAAKVGDKTMMDALIPAVEAAQKAGGDVAEILTAAAAAAKEGAQASQAFVSKFGRAKSYKEQTIGTPDAGAVSTSLFFQGLAQGFEQAE